MSLDVSAMFEAQGRQGTIDRSTRVFGEWFGRKRLRVFSVSSTYKVHAGQPAAGEVGCGGDISEKYVGPPL